MKNVIDGSTEEEKLLPRCEDPDECFKCLTSPVGPRFTTRRIKLIPRWLFQKCDESSTLNKDSFDMQLFCGQNSEFKKLAKAGRADLAVFIKEVIEERTERESYWKEQGDAKKEENESHLFMESNVLLALEAELNRAFNRLKRSTEGFSEAQEAIFSTLEDPSDASTGYSDLNFWYDSILQDAYLLRTRLFLTMDYLYALHLADAGKALDYVAWKAGAMEAFNKTFDIPSRNRIVHMRFMEARSPILMYLLRVHEEMKERFSNASRVQEHLRSEREAWEKYLATLKDSAHNYSTFVTESVAELGLFS